MMLHYLTIGFAESHDILFAKQVNEFLNYPHHILEIDSETFSDISSKIQQKIKLIIYHGMKTALHFTMFLNLQKA